MKNLLLSCVAMIAPVLASAQIITTSPAILERSSQNIVITYHADQGNKGLAGLAADVPVYAHTGTLAPGASDSAWENAPKWGDNDAKYKMTYVGPNTYTLNIGSINSFYGIQNDAKVGRLAFVFRDATGSKQGKTNGGGDIFVTVYPAGEFVMELGYDTQTTPVSVNQKINLTVNTTVNSTINLYEGSTSNTPFATVSNAKQLKGAYTISKSGDTKIIATANDGKQTLTKEVVFAAIGKSTAKNYPGGIPKMGPVENADGSVTFCLGAPEKNDVILLGSWNDFAFVNDQVMNYQDYNGYRYFWVTVPKLNDGQDHKYYFHIDRSMNVGDPYARLVLLPDEDASISSVVYPDKPKYPSEYVTGVPVAVYNSNMSKYDWKVENFVAPDKDHLNIYELLVRDFTGTEGKAVGNGTIRGVINKLDYIQYLGINAIELMPIMEFNGNKSWGYNPNFYFAPDKAYGTPDDYKELIDKCHQRGIAVILDIVFNQSDGKHPWFQMYDIHKSPFYNMYSMDNPKGYEAGAPHTFSVLNDWKQENPLVTQQFKDCVQYWMKEYKVDGYRFDLVKGLGDNTSYGATYNAELNAWTNVSDGGTNKYNQTRIDRMKGLHDAMRAVNPNAYFINEGFLWASEENEMAKDGEMNWANVNNASCQFAMGYPSGADLNRFYAPDDGRTWGSTVSYAESHDEERMAKKIELWGVSIIKNSLELTCRRLGSVGAQMLMAPGSHMIWAFQEFGADEATKSYETTTNPDGTKNYKEQGNNTGNKKVVWSYLDEPNRAGLKRSYTELNFFRLQNPELFNQGVATTMQCNQGNWNTGNRIILRTGNKGAWLVVNAKIDGEMTINLEGADANNLQLMSASYNVTPKLNGTNVTLPGGAYALYGTKNLAGIENIEEGDMIAAPQVYGAVGEIVVCGACQSVEVYDIAGRHIGRTNNLPAGLYVAVVDGNATKVAVK